MSSHDMSSITHETNNDSIDDTLAGRVQGRTDDLSGVPSSAAGVDISFSQDLRNEHESCKPAEVKDLTVLFHDQEAKRSATITGLHSGRAEAAGTTSSS